MRSNERIGIPAMKLLNGPEASEEIKRLASKSNRLKLAVAFWGDNAGRKLGLIEKAKTLSVICNLSSGGTNPKEVEALMSAGANVRQNSELHAKVYLFEDAAIVGSSNASENGLSYQSDQCTGWIEQNVLIDDPSTIKALEKWFEAINSETIEQSDLDAAYDVWTRRRNLIIQNPSQATLLDALISNPNVFKDRRLFIVGYTKELHPKSEAAIKKYQSENEKYAQWSGFDNWDELPNAADLVTFKVGRRSSVAFEGFWRMPESKIVLTSGDHEINLSQKIATLAGYRQIGSMEHWQEALLESRRSGRWTGDGLVADLGEFGSLYFSGHQSGETDAQSRLAPESASPLLAKKFEKALRSAADRAIRECRYTPHEFLKMLNTLGGVTTAKRLLAKGGVSTGFTKLWLLGRKDLTTEAIVLDEHWAPLFTPREIQIAKHRLSTGK